MSNDLLQELDLNALQSSANSLIQKLDELVLQLRGQQDWRLYEQKINTEVVSLMLDTAAASLVTASKPKE